MKITVEPSWEIFVLHTHSVCQNCTWKESNYSPWQRLSWSPLFIHSASVSGGPTMYTKHCCKCSTQSVLYCKTKRGQKQKNDFHQRTEESPASMSVFLLEPNVCWVREDAAGVREELILPNTISSLVTSPGLSFIAAVTNHYRYSGLQ